MAIDQILCVKSILETSKSKCFYNFEILYLKKGCKAPQVQQHLSQLLLSLYLTQIYSPTVFNLPHRNRKGISLSGPTKQETRFNVYVRSEFKIY